MWPFRPRSIVNADAEAWLTENFCWLMQQFGWPAEMNLILPKPGFFKSNGETGHALAVHLFEQVKNYCGMSAWDVDLVVDNNPLAESAHVYAARIASREYAAGTFWRSEGQVQISYVPALLQQPGRFITTMAHELAHYVLTTATEAPPCTDEEMEVLTDLAAVYMGFGVFLANGSFEWGAMGRCGYLTERDIIFALALFLRAKNLMDKSLIDKSVVAEPAIASLKPHLAGQLRKALRYLTDDAPTVMQIRGALATAEKHPRRSRDE